MSGTFIYPDKGVTLSENTTGAGNIDPNGTTTTAPVVTVEPGTGEPAFPANTPVAEMTHAQQAAYWKASSRKHEQRSKTLGTPEEIKKLRDDAAELEKLRLASMGEQERAVTAAKAEATTATAHTYALRLVAAEFRAATAGRLTPEELSVVLEPMDLAKFLDAAGDVDTAKVTTYADKVAPKAVAGKKFPDLGQGARETTATPSVATGRAAYAASKGTTT